MDSDTRVQAARDLDAAADYIEVHGWCKGDLRDFRGQVCAEGAIAKVVLSDLLTHPMQIARAEHVLGICVTGSEAVWEATEPDQRSLAVERFATAADALTREITERYSGTERGLLEEGPCSEIVIWNDGMASGRDEVIEAFRAAAKHVTEPDGDHG